MRNLFGMRMTLFYLPVLSSTLSSCDIGKRCASVVAFQPVGHHHRQSLNPPWCWPSKSYVLRRRIQYYANLKSSESKVYEESQDSHSESAGGSSAVLSQKPTTTESLELQMLSFYDFQNVEDPGTVRNGLFEEVRKIPGLRGTIYVAKEGINAQMAVPPGPDLERLLNVCSTLLPFDPFAENPPNLGAIVPISTPTFNKLIVRTRDFILRDGISHNEVRLDWSDAGAELSPSEWHKLIQEDDVVLLDCRNSYESDEGTFSGAIPLETKTFQDSWERLDELTANVPREKPIYIFCTGGIRCKFGFIPFRKKSNLAFVATLL